MQVSQYSDGQQYRLPTKNGCILFLPLTRELFVNTFQVHDSVANLMSRVDNYFIKCRGQFVSNTKTEDLEELPSIAKEFPEEKVQKQLLSSFHKTMSTQTSGSVPADKIEQVTRTNFQLELIESVDCFLDGHGNYDNNLLSFKIISLETNHFLDSKVICIYQLAVQTI